jgi:hypothetical protein
MGRRGCRLSDDDTNRLVRRLIGLHLHKRASPRTKFAPVSRRSQISHLRRSRGREFTEAGAAYSGATGIWMSQVKIPVFESKLASVG